MYISQFSFLFSATSVTSDGDYAKDILHLGPRWERILKHVKREIYIGTDGDKMERITLQVVLSTASPHHALPI